MDTKKVKNFLFDLFILEVVLFTLTLAFWLYTDKKYYFYTCLFIAGAIFAGLGTVFWSSAHETAMDDAIQRARTGTSMSDSESRRRTWQDITISYLHSSLFLWSGLIAVAISYVIYYYA